MRVVLFRHGIAIDRDDPACPARDEDRALTPRGVARTREAARGLAKVAPEIDLVIESPYLRARQTADHLTEALGLDAATRVVEPSLPPFGDTEQSAAVLAELDAACPVVVGHAPHLDDLIGQLVGAGREITRLKKAGAACIEDGQLLWALPPRILRELGRAPR